jgi:methyl-accepting chemotaxis protein
MAIGMVVVTTISSGYFATSDVINLKERLDAVVDKTARKLELSGRIDAIKSGMLVSQDASILAVFMKDAARESALRREFDEQVATMRSALAEVRPLLTMPEGKRLLAVVEANFNEWLSEHREVARLCEAGDPAGAGRHSLERILPVYNRLATASAQFIEIYRRVLEDDKKQAEDQYSKSLWAVIVTTFISLLCIGCGWLLVRGIIIGTKLAASELAATAEQLSTAAGQVSSSGQSLAQGASEQAASLEETSASSEELSSMTRKNAENSQQAAEFMNAMSERVVVANRVLGEMMTSMHEIGASSGKISKIIKVIDEIAFQTNILALNAAVEAARAGEAGMGFAVVAAEVRNLAQRSAQAARDTADLIEDSIAKSGEGSGKLSEVAASIQAITEGAVKVKTLVDEVDASSKEQALGIEQISKSIAQMDKVTQQTSANAEQSANASEALNGQAQTLLDLVERLQSMVGAVAVPVTRGASRAGRTSPSTLRPPARSFAPPVTMARNNSGEFPLDDSEFKEF